MLRLAWIESRFPCRAMLRESWTLKITRELRETWTSLLSEKYGRNKYERSECIIAFSTFPLFSHLLRSSSFLRCEHRIIPLAVQGRWALPWGDMIDEQAVEVAFPCRAYVPRMPVNSRNAVKFRNSKQNRAPTIDFRRPYVTSHRSHWLHP